MVNIIIDPTRDPKEAPLVTDENEDEFRQPRPINKMFEVALIACMQKSPELKKKKIRMDMGIDEEDGKARRDIGVFSADVGRFKITVNWTPDPHGNIPPGHIYVEYANTAVATLAPYTDGLPIDGYAPVTQWFGLFVKPQDLWEACAVAICNSAPAKKHLFQAFGGDVVDDLKAGRDTDNTPFSE